MRVCVVSGEKRKTNRRPIQKKKKERKRDGERRGVPPLNAMYTRCTHLANVCSVLDFIVTLSLVYCIHDVYVYVIMVGVV